MGIIDVGIGFMLLITGRPAYWVFTGAIAYWIGGYFAERFALFAGPWNSPFLSLLFATLGIFSALLFHRWAARVAGFIAGGFLVYQMPVALGAQADWATPLYFIIGGAVGLVLLLLSFDFALLVLSSLTGATFILRTIHIGNIDQASMFLIFTVFGMIAQYLILQYAKPSPD